MHGTTSIPRTIAKVALGGVLISAGIGHLTKQRQEFQAQVPDWVPLSKDAVVLASGGVEIVLGTALITVVRRKALIGRLAALFFALVFPGNVSQFITKTPAFGLDTDRKRAVRLVLQPVLIGWALWSTQSTRKR